MAEVFGNRDDFAIEAGTESYLKPPSAVWGRMCVWCCGVPLGDIDDRHCALYPAYCGFRSLLSPVHGEPKIDRLWAEELAGLDDVAAWNFLDGLLYGYHGDVEVPDDRTLEECRRDAVVWLPDGMGRAVEVSRDEFVAACEGFVRWFEEQDLRLRGP